MINSITPITITTGSPARMPIRAISCAKVLQHEEVSAINRINEAIAAITRITSSFSYRSLCNSLLAVSYNIVTPKGAITAPIKAKMESEGYRIGTCRIDDGVLIVPCIAVSAEARKRSPTRPVLVKRSSTTQFITTSTATVNTPTQSCTGGPIIAPTKSHEHLLNPAVTVTLTNLAGEVIESENIPAVISEIKATIGTMKYINYCRLKTELTKERFSIVRPNTSATTPIESIMDKYNVTFVSCANRDGFLHFTCTPKPRRSLRLSRISPTVTTPVIVAGASTIISDNSISGCKKSGNNTIPSPSRSYEDTRTLLPRVLFPKLLPKKVTETSNTQVNLAPTTTIISVAGKAELPDRHTTHATPQLMSSGKNIGSTTRSFESPLSPSTGLYSRAATWRAKYIMSKSSSSIPRPIIKGREIIADRDLPGKGDDGPKTHSMNRSTSGIIRGLVPTTAHTKGASPPLAPPAPTLASVSLSKNCYTTSKTKISNKIIQTKGNPGRPAPKNIIEKSEKGVFKQPRGSGGVPKNRVIVPRSSVIASGEKNIGGGKIGGKSFMVEWIKKIGGEKWVNSEVRRGQSTKKATARGMNNHTRSPATVLRRHSVPAGGSVAGGGRRASSHVGTKFQRRVTW